MKRLVVACISAAFAIALFSVPAGAASGTGPPPFPSCHPLIPANAFGPGQPPVNLPSTGPCSETGHFGLALDIATPGGQCSPPVPLAILGSGNGIFHSNVNAADDWWTTSTFEGDFTAYQLLGFGLNGPKLGPALLTGHEEEWFGDSFNANNFVDHGIINIDGTTTSTPSQPVSVHLVFHASSTGGNPYAFGLPPFLEASNVFFKAVC